MTSKNARGGRRTAPYAFTEQGVAMLSSVLDSPRAIGVNIEIMRTFVRVRELAATHSELAKRLSELEEKTELVSMQHDTFSRNTRNQLKQVFDALRELMTPPNPPKRPIGFVTHQERSKFMPKTNMTTPQKTALITGVTGQDGSYLAEFLLEKGYTVHGIKRRASLFNTQRVDHIYQDPHVDNARFKLHYGDLSDSSNLTRIIQETQPDEIYNLGAQSHVAVSFESPEYTADVGGMGTS